MKLRPYQKPCERFNSTQARCDEGEITIQTCGKEGTHSIAFAVMHPTNGKTRWVLACLECGFYEEVDDLFLKETINKKEYDLVVEVLGEDLAKREIGLCTDDDKAEEEFAVETYKKIGRILVAHKEDSAYVVAENDTIQVEEIPARECLGNTFPTYNKYFIGDRYRGLIAIVPKDDDLYDPLVGLTKAEAYKYVQEHSEDFDKANPTIRLGLLDFFSRLQNAR